MPTTKQEVAAPKGLSQDYFGMFNPHLFSRKAATVRVRDIAPKSPILSYFTPAHYGELHPSERKVLKDGYKRFGFQRGLFAESPTDAFSGKRKHYVGGMGDITAPESTISEFWKDRSNLGAFSTQLLKSVKDISPAVLGDLSPDGRVFKEWAKQMGFVTPGGAIDMKKAKDVATFFVEAYDNKVLAEKATKRENVNRLAEWLKFVAGEYRTPWIDDDLLGPAETTEVKFAESVYKDLVSSKYNALNGLKNSLRKFNEGARLLSAGAARSAAQASPRARALLKRDIEYLRDFRGVVESMMKDFSITLSTAAPSTPAPSSSAPLTGKPPQSKPSAASKQTDTSPTKESAPVSPNAPVQEPIQTQAPVSPNAPVQEPIQTQAPVSPNAPVQEPVQTPSSKLRDYEDLQFDSLAAQRAAALQKRPWYQDTLTLSVN